MAEKKTATAKAATKTTKAATTKAAAVKTTEKKATAKTACACKKDLYINAESVGFRAGDVYQALASAEKNLTVAEIAKAAKIEENEVLLGIGWLFKEGKIKDEDNKVALA